MNISKFRYLILSGALLALIASCSSNATVETTIEEPEVEETTDSKIQPSKVTMALTPISNQMMFDDAKLLMMDYEGSTFKFKYSGETYRLGDQTEDKVAEICANSGKGNHIHLIVDNGPYSAIYEPNFQKEIPDGEHEVVAFLGRSYHMSIKQPEAVQALKATFEGGMMKSRKKITEPRLIYSRPKGTYAGDDAKNILVDFYALNAEIGTEKGQYTVQAQINEKTMTMREWKPFILTGLPMGEHTLTLTLLDSEGKKADIPFNPVSRTFTLMQEPETN